MLFVKIFRQNNYGIAEYYENLYLVAYGVISWTTAFLLTRKLLPNLSFDICKRIVSTIHAVFAVVLCLISVQDWTCPVCPLASNLTPLQERALAVSLAYLIYDLVCCWFEKNLKMDTLVHHLVSIVGITTGVVNETCGSEMVATLCITEIPSPFLHLRELLKELAYKDTNLSLAADVSFVVFFTARMCFGSYIFYVILFSNNPIIIKAMGVGLTSVSTFWFYKILRMIKYRLAKRSISRTSS